MTRKFIVSGTDTGIGKTVVSAMLVQALRANYFKPVQAGLDEETDTEFVKRLSQFPEDHYFAELYRLETPASPHLAARLDDVEIDTSKLILPESNRTLIVEGAGGLMVPLTESTLLIDIIQNWQVPVILCARTELGTINHSLLSINALRQWNIPVHGVVFIGDSNLPSESIISKLGNVKHLGRLPFLNPLNSETLSTAFAENFHLSDFE